MEENNSELTGSQPGNTEEKTDVSAESSTANDAKSESSTDQPWHKDPRFKQELGLLKVAKSLMEKNGLESVDDLVELAESGKKIKGKESDIDMLDEIKAKAAKLDKYEAYWKDQEEKKLRETEYPDQTIARLEKQLKEKEAADRHKEQTNQQREAAQHALKSYEREVQSLVKEMDVPKEQQAFVNEFFGVGNPFNEIDITDRKAIKRLVADGIKKKEAYDQAIIKAYINGKGETPKVGTASAAAPSGDKPKIYLKDARKTLLEALTRRE